MKKGLKKMIAVVLTAAMAMSAGLPAFADDSDAEKIILQPGESYTEELDSGLTITHFLEVDESQISPYATLKSGEAHYYITVYQNSLKVARANLNVWYSYGDNRVFITDVKPILTRYNDVEGTVIDFSTDYSASANGAKTVTVTGEYYLKREYPNGINLVSTPEVEITFTCNGDDITVTSTGVKAN